MPRQSVTLPRSLDAAKGLRAARWIRESTAGQFDNWGPQAQLDQQDGAIVRYALVDTGLCWSAAASGWKDAWKTPAWAGMIAAAHQGAFDVLVVGYVSRFLRNVKQALVAVEGLRDPVVVEGLHEAGVCVLFADERILSSDPDDWDSFLREAHDAESFSRKHSKRVGEAYAAKRRLLGVPGGNRAPLGTIREGRPSQLRVDAERLALVRRAYDLSASGLTDRRVAEELGLKLTHVHSLLTNPFYRGQLRDGSPSVLGPLVAPATWDKVQLLRGQYGRRHKGAVRRRRYALAGLLTCQACGRRLTGHVGRYRHVGACDRFRAARPAIYQRFARNLDHRVRGESYKAEWYDTMVGAALQSVAVSNGLMAETMPKALQADRAGDPFTLARIERDRGLATARYLRNRDLGALEAEMARLDVEERASMDRAIEAVTPQKARAYLSDLWMLWRETEPEGRQAIAAATFEKIDALGLSLTLHLTAEAEAYGWADAFGPDSLEVPLAGSIGHSGRGERGSPSLTHDAPRFLMTNATSHELLLADEAKSA